MTNTPDTFIERHKDSLTDKITVDFQSIPQHVLDDLCAATVASVKAVLRQPGGAEILEARMAARKAAQADKERMQRSGDEAVNVINGK